MWFIEQDPIGLCRGYEVRGNNPYQTRGDPHYPGRPHYAFSIDNRTLVSGILISNCDIRKHQEFWSQ